MTEIQNDLDYQLSKTYVIPVEIDSRGPIPAEKKYASIRELTRTGFSLTIRELLHAIGCKVACLPASEEDECFKSAYYFTHLLDFESSNLRYKRDPDSDLQTARSQDVGIGFTCLIANKCYGIPWDQLNALPGPKRRFDFRGSTDSLRCIFEAKGTKYSHKQREQIADGIDKKKEYHKRGEQFDIELVISSLISVGNQQPRIVIADPTFDEYGIAFDARSDTYFKHRHYARVMQFIGATSLSRRLYMESHDLLHGSSWSNEIYQQYNRLDEFDYLRIGKDSFIGHWYHSSAPLDSSRYRRFIKIELPRPINKFPRAKIAVFQAILEENFNLIKSKQLKEIKLLTVEQIKDYRIAEDGSEVSVFPDGSALVVKVIE